MVFTIKMILNTITSTLKIIKRASILWLIPLLLMTTLLVINKDPITILNSFLMNSSNLIYCCKLFLKVIGAIAATALVFTILLVIINRKLRESKQTFLTGVQICFLPVIVLSIIKLIVLNLVIDCFVGWFQFCKLLWVLWNYLLLYLANIFFYYVLNSVIDTETTVKKFFVARIKNSFSWQVVIELLIMAFLASVIALPIMHYPKHILFQADPMALICLRLVYSSLIHTFLIVYTAVLYYGWDNRDNET
jgi:hypothetical protein